MKDITTIIEGDRLAKENLLALMSNPAFLDVPCKEPVLYGNCRQWLVKSAVRRYRKAEAQGRDSFNHPLAGALAGVMVRGTGITVRPA